MAYSLELVKPASLPHDDWYDFTKDTYGANIHGGQRIDRGGPSDRYVKWWDDQAGTPPDESTISADYAVWKALPDNDDNSKKLDKDKAFTAEYFDKKIWRTIRPRVKAVTNNSSTQSERRDAIRAEIDALIQKVEDL